MILILRGKLQVIWGFTTRKTTLSVGSLKERPKGFMEVRIHPQIIRPVSQLKTMVPKPTFTQGPLPLLLDCFIKPQLFIQRASIPIKAGRLYRPAFPVPSKMNLTINSNFWSPIATKMCNITLHLSDLKLPYASPSKMPRHIMGIPLSRYIKCPAPRANQDRKPINSTSKNK